MELLGWIEANVAPLRLAMGATTVVVWIAYLQLLLASLRRQRRTQIMINRGVGVGLDARCLIANLGHEPLYVMEMIARIETDEGAHEAVVTDRADLNDEELNDPSEAAHQGPVKSGEGYDAGSFGEHVRKVRRIEGVPERARLSRVELTVVAATAAKGQPVAAVRGYRVTEGEHGPVLRPEGLQARQVRSLGARRRLKRRLKRDLAAGLT